MTATGTVVALARTDEMPAVFALRHEVFVRGQGVPEELELDELDAVCDHVVARVEGQVVGTGRLLPAVDSPIGRVGRIGRMAVADSARRRGVGAAVLERLEQRAAERGDAAVELHAQLHARPFYARAGYTAYGPVFDDAGIDHVAMRKAL